MSAVRSITMLALVAIVCLSSSARAADPDEGRITSRELRRIQARRPQPRRPKLAKEYEGKISQRELKDITKIRTRQKKGRTSSIKATRTRKSVSFPQTGRSLTSKPFTTPGRAPLVSSKVARVPKKPFFKGAKGKAGLFLGVAAAIGIGVGVGVAASP